MVLTLRKDNIFTQLPADKVKDNLRRQVVGACFSYVLPTAVTSPQLVAYSAEMADELGLSATYCQQQDFADIFTGNKLLAGSKPYAMCYGGHQFGNWAGQLGDGRAINLGELINQGKRYALQLKGAGLTPYSRRGDGLAVLRSSVREFLCSEAMYHLGVPTTRALSLTLTGESVLRDIFYDGQAKYELGAVVCRVAESFVRFGSFEIHHYHQDIETLKKLVNYTITNFYPHLLSDNQINEAVILAWFAEVANRSAEMVVHWQRVGFVHGVMNTDNMSILGLTIDYGPYGWLENYDEGWTPNTTDKEYKRYSFGQQPAITHWNLYQLAVAIQPLVDDNSSLEAVLAAFKANYDQQYQRMMRDKLGLVTEQESDSALITDCLELLSQSETDMTLFFRLLSTVTVTTQFPLEEIKPAFYQWQEIVGDKQVAWQNWFLNYQQRLSQECLSDYQRQSKMNKVNPKYVLRNYMAQLAIDAAEKGDYTLIGELLDLLRRPYAEQPENERWFAKRPEWARNRAGCSMLSCSS